METQLLSRSHGFRAKLAGVNAHASSKVVVFLVVLVLDQVTKIVAYSLLQEGESVAVIPGFFNFTLVYNPGAAFGMFADWPDLWRRTVLSLVSLVAMFVVLRFMQEEAKNDLPSQYALAAILGGAFGNIIDRIRFDRVVDFIDVYWAQYHWPAFNIADSAISIGVCVLILRVVAKGTETQE